KLGTKHSLDSFTPVQPSSEQVALTAALVDEIVKTCSDRGIKTLILNLPMEQNGDWMRNLPTEALKSQTTVVHVATRSYHGHDIWEIGNQNSYHPKPKGHQLIADWLADYVTTQVW